MYQSFFKRIIDILCALLGIIGTSPFWFLAIIGIEISDPGPVFYMAKRVGKDNALFSMFKFRSMRIDRNANENSLRPDQDRIFWWGKVIRRLKIDELPQLLNILNGSMSIIGPRPASVDQVQIVRGGKYAMVSNVACGLSGPSALYDYIYGDQFTDEDEYMEKVLPTRLELDYFYVHHVSFGYDSKMVWYTIVSIIYALIGKEPKGILRELERSADISKSSNKQ